MKKVARANGARRFPSRFKFDTEKDNEELEKASNGREFKKIGSGNEYGITTSQYIWNLIMMILLFTCFSFSFWLIDFQAEYLGTDIFILFYANGLVCIVAGNINLVLYPRLGLKWLIVCTQSVAILSASYMVMVQQKIIGFDDEEREEVFVQVSIPVALLFLSLAI